MDGYEGEDDASKRRRLRGGGTRVIRMYGDGRREQKQLASAKTVESPPIGLRKVRTLQRRELPISYDKV